MLVNKIGEFGLIERFRKLIRTDSSVVVGSGDDCAVLRFDKNSYQLFTCDMIVEGVDFTLRDKPYLIGRKALAISISDIAACAGIPHQALVSIGMPKNTKVELIDEIFRGIHDLARKFGINIVGGDISRSRQMVIDVSMLGRVEKKNLVLRSTAKVGDIIFVSGPLGGSIRGKHLGFTPRLKAARLLVKDYKINSMIDISDGLVQDLRHITGQSKVGAAIYELLIPIAIEARSMNEALYMGEDFELLFTVSPGAAKRILKRNYGFFPIGEITEIRYGLRLVDKQGREKSPQLKGFRHF